MDAYVGRGNSYVEYGHDEGIKQAQKDFLRALHFNPTSTKARISLGYNLQVILYKNGLGRWKDLLDKRKNIFGSLLMMGTHAPSLVWEISPFPHY